MIWIMLTMIMETKDWNLYLISKTMNMKPELKIILIMTMISLLLNEMMIFKNTTKSENFQEKMIVITGIFVMMAFLSESTLNLLMYMELTIYPLSLVILSSSKDKDKSESLKFMVLLNTFGSIPFMMYANIKNSFNYTEYSMKLSESNTMMMMMILMFAVKTPIFILHIWLTKVHVSASGNCSMILASIMIKMGTMGMYKFLNFMKAQNLFNFFMSLATVSSLYFVMSMMRFFDAKTLIAMSSILHMSMIIPMEMVGSSKCMISSVMMMSSHGVISYFLFYLLTIKYEKTENRSSIFLKSMESLSKTLSLSMVIFMFLNLGIPPFMNFLSESMFLNWMAMSKSMYQTMILMISLLMSIMFTMQMNTNMVFQKMEMKKYKNNMNMLELKSFFFFMWSCTIILFL